MKAHTNAIVAIVGGVLFLVLSRINREIAAWVLLLTIIFLLSRREVRILLWDGARRLASVFRSIWSVRAGQFHFLSAVFFAIVGFLLLGLPGGLILSGHDFLLRSLTSSSYFVVSGDAAWPAAILVTLLWPWGFFLGWLCQWSFLPQQPRIWRALSYTGVVLSWGVLVCVLAVA